MNTPDTALTVAVLGVRATRRPVGVAATLAELAATDELLLVYGWDAGGGRPGLNAMLAGMRERLPRHKIVTVYVARAHFRGPELATVADLLEDGCLPVVVTRSSAVRDVAAEFAASLRADRVLSICCAATGAVMLRQVWDRRRVRRWPVLAAP